MKRMRAMVGAASAGFTTVSARQVKSRDSELSPRLSQIAFRRGRRYLPLFPLARTPWAESSRSIQRWGLLRNDLNDVVDRRSRRGE
jgi:hypothetical protein